MKSLFLRFYLGVLLILAVAWGVQTYAFQQSSAEEGLQMVEEVVGGGARLARDVFEKATDAEERERTLIYLNSLFDYPVRVYPIDGADQSIRARFASGADVVADVPGPSLMFAAPVSSGEDVLVFGEYPLPAPRPNRWVTMGKLGIVMTIAAIAIALLLRPVALQLHTMEKTAIAIAGGDLSARVEAQHGAAGSAMANAFNAMVDRVEQLLRTQRELLQVVSHELRTPVSRIHFAVDLLRDADSEAERRQRLDSLDGAATELDVLIAELLQYVQVETGQLPLELEKLSLRSLVEELIEEQSPIHHPLQMEIGRNLAHLDFTLVADRRRLRRALGNIVGNAGRFSKSRIVIDARQDGETICIQVDDDGKGVREADRDRVFEPFVRCDETGGGTGLGLALVHRIVTRHGGAVSASESPIGGARFEIRMPISKS